MLLRFRSTSMLIYRYIVVVRENCVVRKSSQRECGCDSRVQNILRTCGEKYGFIQKCESCGWLRIRLRRRHSSHSEAELEIFG